MIFSMGGVMLKNYVHIMYMAHCTNGKEVFAGPLALQGPGYFRGPLK